MLKTFERLMAGAIDYAGLFPPAQLTMDDALNQYAGYRDLDDAWMLGRFICPASRLVELQQYRDTLIATGKPFRFAVLGSNGKNTSQFIDRLARDVDDINAFLAFFEKRVQVEVFETRLPEAFVQSPDHASMLALLQDSAPWLGKIKTPTLSVFYEAGLGKRWRDLQSAAIRAIAEHQLLLSTSETPSSYQLAGFKMRCGGAEPQHYPTLEQLANAIATCLRFAVPMKATAGLHHPLRHMNTLAKTDMHGFLNLIGAVVLADVHGLDSREIEAILGEASAGNFLFTDRAFSWQGLRASFEDIRKSRSRRFISFGSCSFDEPREDLVKLGLL